MDDRPQNPQQKQRPQDPQKPAAQGTLWNVLVRHSSFVVKNLNIQASTPDEAKRIFLTKVEAAHLEKVRRYKGPDKEKTAERIMSAYSDGAARLHELAFVIRPAADVQAEKDANQQRVRLSWGGGEPGSAVAPGMAGARA